MYFVILQHCFFFMSHFFAFVLTVGEYSFSSDSIEELLVRSELDLFNGDTGLCESLS